LQKLSPHPRPWGADFAWGVIQPRISNLIRGKIDLFWLEMLVNMLAAVGLRVTLQVKKGA
jgi:predicted XRE-type DNA-binding protein